MRLKGQNATEGSHLSFITISQAVKLKGQQFVGIVYNGELCNHTLFHSM